MKVRAFYWDPRPQGTLSKLRRRRHRNWVHGNAGDIFNVDLVHWAYAGHRILNTTSPGPRLLLVGSVARLVQGGDVVNGIGAKGMDALPPASAGVAKIRGLRGPLTLQAFEAAGHDVSDVRFLADPGLLIGKIWPDLLDVEAVPNRVIDIPHYRHRGRGNPDPRVEVVDIDADPHDIGREIRRAELVYTSSLHGLIWAHALGRPVVLTEPPAEEPRFKYEDYLLSVGQTLGSTPSLAEALDAPKPADPVDVTAVIESITMPDIGELQQAGIAS